MMKSAEFIDKERRFVPPQARASIEDRPAHIEINDSSQDDEKWQAKDEQQRP
jgi:hypothetical protein